MASPRVFLVTNGNEVGESIVRILLRDKEEKIVYLTYRNAKFDAKALKKFQENGMHPRFHQLDITDKNSIEALRDHLVKEHGGLDVLVNNAVGFGPPNETINRYFFGSLQTCDILFPILRKNAYVQHVYNRRFNLAHKKLSGDWKLKFFSEDLTMEELKGYISQFVLDAQEGKVEENGWPISAHGMTKIGVSLMARVQYKEMAKTDRNISVNACSDLFCYDSSHRVNFYSCLQSSNE